MAARWAQRTTPTISRLCWLLYVSDTRMRPRSSESSPSLSCRTHKHTHTHGGGHLFHCTHPHPVIAFTARSTPEIIGWLSSFLLMEDNVCTKVKHLPVCHYATGIYVKTTPRGHSGSDVGQRIRVMQCVPNVCNIFLVAAFCQQHCFFISICTDFGIKVQY